MSIDRPIFIIGSGRSGTTLLYRLISSHPDLSYFSNLSESYPSISWTSLTQRTFDIPYLGSFLRQKIRSDDHFFPWLQPSEGNAIYQTYCGLPTNKRTVPQDVSREQSALLLNSITNHLRFSGKKRFISKQTAHTQRLQYIHEQFPNAIFIYIIRDGRAVVHSLLHTSWWANTQLWWKQGQTPRRLENDGQHVIQTASKHWIRNNEEIIRVMREHNINFIRISYESLIKNPVEIIQSLLSFCDLPQYPEYISGLPKKLPNMNTKWKRHFTKGELAMLHASLQKALPRFGYI